MNKMDKNVIRNNVILAVILAVVYGMVMFAIFMAANEMDKLDKPSAIKAEQCQYPNRPLVNGNCDNSDPAVPECIKAEDEKACADKYKQYDNQPKVEMLPSVGGSGK